MPAGRALLAGRPIVVDAERRLLAGLRRSGIAVASADGGGVTGTDGASCPVLAWAGSGAMSLTGWPDEPPQWPDGDVIGGLSGAAHLLGSVAQRFGVDLELDVGALLTERAAARASARQGGTSFGGHCQLVRTVDSWVAINLARPSDLDLLPALTDGVVHSGSTDDGPDVDPVDRAALWDGLKEFARQRPGGELTAAAQLLGIPVGHLAAGSATGHLPWTISQLGESVRPGPRFPTVVDFSSLWAGPVCAHLLGRCGARVVKVEDGHRPDGARDGDAGMFGRLHRGHEQLTFDFRSTGGRRELASLVDSADVVIESSRPRALAALGFTPEQFLGARAGRTWISITGYGRSGPRSNWVAFGDDAAVTGGLVGRSGTRSPVFCADAIADPVSGLFAATGALASIAQGGGHLVDCSMQASAAFLVNLGTCRGDHRVEQEGSSWFAYHGQESREVEPPRQAR